MIRLWCAANNVEQARLAEQWQASPSTVTRFLANEHMPNGPTMARIIAWLLDSETPTGEEMCPNCVTPWKCNGPHIPQ